MNKTAAYRPVIYCAKTIHQDIWVYGYLFAQPASGRYCIISGEIQWYVDPATIGEWTGIHDDNGERVFEGDRCRIGRAATITYGVITFNNGSFWFKDDGPGGLLRVSDIKANGFSLQVVGDRVKETN